MVEKVTVDVTVVEEDNTVVDWKVVEYDRVLVRVVV